MAEQLERTGIYNLEVRSLSTVVRIVCPECGTECIDPEANCWQCGSLMKPRPPKEIVEQTEQQLEKASFFKRKKKAPEAPAVLQEAPIKFDGLTAADLQLEPPNVEDSQETRKTQFVTLMTGEIVEVPDDSIPPKDNVTTAATIGNAEIVAEPSAPIFVLTFCKACGYQNPEGVLQCVKCRSRLEVVPEPTGWV